MKNYIEVLKKYALFTGRAGRREYWMFVLVSFVIAIAISVGLGIVASADVASIVSLVYALAVLLPSIAVSVRRLHDIGRSGWWLLIALVPFIGVIVLLIFYLLDSQSGENKYGPNPKGVVAVQAVVPEPVAQDSTSSSAP